MTRHVDTEVKRGSTPREHVQKFEAGAIGFSSTE